MVAGGRGEDFIRLKESKAKLNDFMTIFYLAHIFFQLNEAISTRHNF